MKNFGKTRRRCGAALAAAVVFGAAALPAAAGSWSSRRPMETPRSHMGAAVLEGEIYVAGGTGILGPIAAFEVYDPKADHWRPLPSLPEGRQQFGMAAFDGRIVVTGGFRKEAPAEESADMWVYDPRLSRWEKGPSMPGARAGHVLVAAAGKLYAIGGSGRSEDRIFVYDLKKRSWSVAPFRFPAPRAGLAAAVMDGHVYVAGGRTVHGGNSTRLDILDVKRGTWRTGAPLPAGRAGLTMAAVGGLIHVAGGASVEDMRTYDTHFAYDPATNSWSRLPPLPTPRHGLASAQVDGHWYVLGGGSGAGFYTVFTDADVVEMYDPQAE